MVPTPRVRLEELRATTLARLAALQSEHRSVVDASRDSNADDEHDPEGATIAFERAQGDALARGGAGRLPSIDRALAQVDALARDAAARLLSIDRALAQVDDGTYGVCETCGAAIPEGRLEARPTA